MSIKILPAPKKIIENEGFLCIKPVFSTESDLHQDILHAFSETADKVFGIEFTPLDIPLTDESLFTPLTETQFSHGEKGESKLKALPGEERCDKGLVIKADPELSEEEYKISVDKICVIEVSGREGLAAALSSVLQMARRTCDKYIKLPKCEIHDVPDSSFRALSVDVARRWHPIDYLYRYVDLCFMFKVNKLILHFTDDESYTLPSDAFPKLVTKNRHYTKAQLAALSEYANDRGVMLVPEIDMPGHCAQILSKYPEVFGKHGIIDATEEAFSALETLYAEAAELFKYSDCIHVGGDEAVLGRWDDSEKTKEYMKKNGIEDYVQLYGHYVGRICESVLSLGKTPIVWEGFHKESNHLIPKEALVIAWESHYQLAPELAEAGFELLNASWKPMYVVSPWQKWSPAEILTWDKYTWDHWWEGSAAYKNKIIIDRSAPVRGGILCAWGDYLKGYESSRLACQLEFASVMPRLGAAAEKLWNTDSTVTEESFDDVYSLCEEKLKLIYSINPFMGKL